MASERVAESATGRSFSVSSLFQYREFAAILAVLVLILIGALIRGDVFLRSDNILGVVRNAAIVSIIGYGMTFLMTAGEFDLSVGSLMGVAGALTVTLYMDGYPILLVVLLVLFGAAIYGIFQGLLITKLDLPSLIVTIGTLTLLQGVLLVILQNTTRSIPSEGFPDLLYYLGGLWELNTPIMGGALPLQIVYVIVFMIIGWYVLNHTPFGYRSKFTGGDPESASRTGINTDRVKIANFMLVAVIAAFAGLSQVGYTHAVSPSTGRGVELIVIASVVIGGTDLFGGEGSVPGVLLGALVFSLTQNILVLAGAGVQLFQVFTGIFIIGAVFIEAISHRVGLSVLKRGYTDPFVSIVSSPTSHFKYVKSNVRDVDAPLIFLLINTLVLTLVTLAVATVLSLVLNWEFSLGFVNLNTGAPGTMALLVFGIVSAITLLTSVFVHGVGSLIGAPEDFDTTLQGVSYSSAPAILLFIPLVLVGFDIIAVVVLGSLILVSLPSFALLYKAIQELHGFGSRDALLTVAGTAACWVLVLAFVAVQLS